MRGRQGDRERQAKRQVGEETDRQAKRQREAGGETGRQRVKVDLLEEKHLLR